MKGLLIAACAASLVAACDASGALGQFLTSAGGLGSSKAGSPAPTHAQAPEPALATLTLAIEITPGGLQTQSVVTNFTRASIDHLLVKVFQVDGNVESPVMAGSEQLGADVPGSELEKTLTISRLPAHTALRIRAYAYKAAGQAEADRISTSDAMSYTDITLSSDDRPVLASLKVRLVDVLFDGQVAPRGVVVTEGGYAMTVPATISF